MSTKTFAVMTTWCAAAILGVVVHAAEPVIAPKVVVVTMFEVGKDSGDVPGELQFWVERRHLDRTVAVPGAYHELHLSADGRLAAVLTGMGNTRSAASIMALGLDPRFDFRKTYWIVAGIAGIDPADGSLGSAAWAEYVVEGDLAHEIDAREMPADWSTGYLPLDKKKPYDPPAPKLAESDGQVYRLNPELVEWAYQLTRDVVLPDNEAMRKRRAAYAGFPQAQRPPFVLKGDNLASSTYWHGAKLNEWANAWVKYYTEGKGNYVTTAMEDTGTLYSLKQLSRTGRVDLDRVLVLRTASNYDRQPPGMTAAESLTSEPLGPDSGYLPSLEAAYRVGSRVVDTLLEKEDGQRKNAE